MAEKSFDALLYQALLEAGWQENRTAWEGTEEPAFSPQYLRWRTRLLADPFGWGKKQLRPLWAKALRTAACILLAASVTLGSLMAVSPTVRAAVLNWLREISGNLMTYTSSQPAKTNTLPSNWRITWLPEGWTLQHMYTDTWKYCGPHGKSHLTFACYTPGDNEITTNLDDVVDAEMAREHIQVGDTAADYYVSDRYQVLLWENEEGFLFMLRGDTFLDQESFLRIAESVAYYEGPDTTYTLEWVPENYKSFGQDDLVGAGQELWTYHGVSLTWRYLADGICGFTLPMDEPEEIPLGDGTAWYWAAEQLPSESEDPPGDFSATVGDVSVSVSVSGPDDTRTATLLWTDPATNTAFFLEGALSREDLVRMAESVVQTEAERDALPSSWRITWLPEGWTLQHMTTNLWKYRGDSGSLMYACYAPGSTDLTTNVDDVSDADAMRESIQIQGHSADYYESEEYRVLLWENEEGFLFLLRGDSSLDRESLLSIAESIVYYDDPGIAYELDWAPSEYEPMYRDELVGAAQEEWTFQKTSLTWRYVIDPVCGFLLPDGEPEEVTLGDFTAQYWAAEEPFEAEDSGPTMINGEPVEGSGSSVTVGGVTITVSGDPDADQTSTLLWTDPGTNTTFLLEGALDRYDLMRMAASVAQTAPNPPPPSHHAALMEGTAGG